MGKTYGNRTDEIFDEVVMFDALQITDTNPKTSNVVDRRGVTGTIFLFANDLDQSVSVQMEGSRDQAFTKVWTIGSPVVITSGSKANPTLSEPWPFVRAVATCASAPSSGSLSGWSESLME